MKIFPSLILVFWSDTTRIPTNLYNDVCERYLKVRCASGVSGGSKITHSLLQNIVSWRWLLSNSLKVYDDKMYVKLHFRAFTYAHHLCKCKNSKYCTLTICIQLHDRGRKSLKFYFSVPFSSGSFSTTQICVHILGQLKLTAFLTAKISLCKFKHRV